MDLQSFAGGFIVCCLMTGSYFYGQHRMIRHIRRVVRHGKNLDLVYFEDAIRDDSIHRKPESVFKAELHAIEERQSGR